MKTAAVRKQVDIVDSKRWLAYATAGAAGALVCQLLFALFFSGVQGPMSATMVEMFPIQLRTSGMGIGYNLSLCLFGGTAPLVATWLVTTYGGIAPAAYYLCFLAVVSLLSAALLMVKRNWSIWKGLVIKS